MTAKVDSGSFPPASAGGSVTNETKPNLVQAILALRNAEEQGFSADDMLEYDDIIVDATVFEKLSTDEASRAIGLLKKYEKRLLDLGIAYGEIIEVQENLTNEAKAKAKEILLKGEAFDYILHVWQKRHHGDATLGKALLFSLGCQSIANSKGIHVAVTGEGGYGKTDGLEEMGKLIDPKFWKFGGMTPQSLFYQGPDMPDSVVVGLDDMVWGSELGTTIKRITAQFQAGATRMTLKEMQGAEVRSSKRIAFWTSCVDNQSDEQIRDRFIMYSVKCGQERSKEIIDYMKAADEGNQPLPEYAFETGVCQAITHDLKTKTFNVKIPFATRIKVEGVIAPRAYAMFRDMIRSSAVFRYMVREKDEDGSLIAIEEDFENAKSLFIEIGGHDRNKYTDPEQNLLNSIVANGMVATQPEIQTLMGKSQGYVSDLLNGRGKAGHGLLHKCDALIVEEGRPKRYRLRPGFNPVDKVKIELT